MKRHNKDDQARATDKAHRTEAQPSSGDRFARYSLLVIVLVAAVVFFTMIKAFLVPVILAAVIAGLFSPFYAWLLKRTRGRRSLSSFVCCALLSLGLLLPVFVVANLGAREAARLSHDAGPQARAFLEGNLEEWVHSLAMFRSMNLENRPLPRAVENLARQGSDLLGKAVNVVSRGTFELIFTLGITFFTMFYFFRDAPELLTKLKHLSPLSDDDLDELIRRFLSVSRATLKGTLLVALIKGTLGGLSFWAFGIPAPVLWGVVMVFLSILPIVGPWLVMYPAALILFLGGHVGPAIALFLIATFVVGLVDNFLQPILVRRDSGMPELLVFFSTVGGIGLFGGTGFIVGPVIAALFLTLLDIYGKEFSPQLALVHNHVNSEGKEPV